MARTQKKRLAAALALSPKHRKREKKQPIQTTLPHHEQPVSLADIDLWCATVAPHISPERRPRYATAYNVPDKIRRAKNAGRWPPNPPGLQFG